MTEHKKKFSDIMYTDEKADFEVDMIRMSKPKTWGGHREIEAMSQLLECQIVLYFSEEGKYKVQMEYGKKDSKILRLIYTNGSGEEKLNHYHFCLLPQHMPKKRLGDMKIPKELISVPSFNNTIELDIRAISFIHLSDYFKEQQDELRKKGAIFTLEQLEEDIEHYVNDESIPDVERYAKQLYLDIQFLLNHWRAGDLNNQFVSDVLDKRTLKVLQKTCWSNEDTLSSSNNCEHEVLSKLIKDDLLSLRMQDYQLWQENKLDVKFSKLLEESLIDGIWEWWRLTPAEGNPLIRQLTINQESIIYQCFQERKMAEEAIQFLTEQLRQRLGILKNLRVKPHDGDPLFAIFRTFCSDVLDLQKLEESIFKDRAVIHDEVIDGLIKRISFSTPF